MMNYLVLIILVSFSLPALALQKQFTFTLEKPLAEAQKTESMGKLRTSGLEKSIKSSLIKMRLQNPSKFFELKKNSLENSELYQSYINEVDEALWGARINRINPKIPLYDQFMLNSHIDAARKIAKEEMFKVLQQNWPKLKETIFNDYGVDTWEVAKIIVTDKMNDMLAYIPQPKSPNYLFLFGENFVQIDKKTLKKVKVALDVNSRLDGNNLPPEAVDIVSDDEGGKKSSQSGPSSNDNNE
jgi:hypothetical protein